MQDLVQGRKKNLNAGEPIFQPFSGLEAIGAVPRRGQLLLIAAGPGTGKSMWTFFMLIIGLHRQAVNRVLYLSADTPPEMMFKRAAQALTGYSLEYIEDRLHSDDAPLLDDIVKAGTDHITMVDLNHPTDDDFRDQVKAYYEVVGDFPEVIVMDNLSNLHVDGGEGEFGELEGGLKFLSLMARETGAAVIALHHVTGKYGNGDVPVPSNGIRGQLDKTPDVCLTLFRDANHLYVSPVKNRNGRSEPNGEWYITLDSDLSRGQYSG